MRIGCPSTNDQVIKQNEVRIVTKLNEIKKNTLPNAAKKERKP